MTQTPGHVERPVEPRAGEAPDPVRLEGYLERHVEGFKGPLTVLQYPGGYSNLTFQLDWPGGSCILRRPPVGADIKSAHDMGREHRVLSLLRPHYPLVPRPIHLCEDPGVIGAPFYLMEKVTGTILRNRVPEGMTLTEADMRALSTAAVSNLAALHSLDLASTGLDRIGKPEGYVARQVEGWIGRYERAMTDDVPAMSFAGEWLRANMPPENKPAFLHNDYKYDNLVLDPMDPGRILCVLDWEMSTVGDPLMDLGTTLAYWTEAGDPAALKPFSLTWTPGNLSREEVVATYAEARGMPVPDVLFHYVFGSYKVGVIVQQIFARYRKGLTQDPRFAGLGHVLRAASDNAARAIRLGRIGNLHNQ